MYSADKMDVNTYVNQKGSRQQAVKALLQGFCSRPASADLAADKLAQLCNGIRAIKIIDRK